MNIFFIGDSNARLFYYCSNFNIIRDEAGTDKFLKGSGLEHFNNHKISFMWKSGMSMRRLNETYIFDTIKKSGFSNIVPDIFLFEFGTLDLKVKSLTFSEIDDLVINYLKKIKEFCNKFNAEFYVITPIVHKNYNVEKNTKYFIDSLYYFCEMLKINDPIDLSKIIKNDFVVDYQDEYHHLNLDDSRKALTYMLEEVAQRVDSK